MKALKSIESSDFSKNGLEYNRYSDGIYEGQLKNGKREGFGIYRWDNGDVYVG